MPCYEIRTVTLDLSGADAETLLAALHAMGHTEARIESGAVVWRRGRFENGKLTGYSTFELTKVKREYAAQAAEQSLKKFGWRTQRNERGQIVATRRTYG